jgi:hypothetical protein
LTIVATIFAGGTRVDHTFQASGAISYASVKSILAQNLDRAPLPAMSVAPPLVERENLRRAGYYADTGSEKEA